MTSMYLDLDLCLFPSGNLFLGFSVITSFFCNFLIGFIDILTFIPNAFLFFLFFFSFRKLQTTKLNTIFLPVLFGHFVYKKFIPGSRYFGAINNKGKIKCFTRVLAKR